MSNLFATHTTRSLLVAIVISLGLALLWQSLVGAQARPDAPAVFSIAPGDAERVPLDREDGICTLAEAVEAANDQGMSDPPLNDCGSASAGLNVIELQAGDYNLTAQVATINGGNTATFNIVTPIAVRGVTSDTTTIRRTDDASEQFRFFHVGSEGILTLEDLGLAGGYANGGSGGGAVYVSGNGTLLATRVQMTANTARYGGALFNGGATTVIDSSFAGNSASEDDASQGGAIYVSNQMTVTTSSITGNESTDSGGGIYVNSTGSGAFWISLSNVSNNLANADAANGGDGGGIYHHVGTLTSTLNSLTLNAAAPSLPDGGGGARGGGIFSSDTLNLFFTLVDGNAAVDGAGFYNDVTGSATVTSTLFIANLAAGNGAGIANAGYLSADNTVVWANVAQGHGGGLYNATSGGPFADLRSSTFYQNQAVTGSGGGILNINDGPTWTALSNVTVAGNSAGGHGGGIANGVGDAPGALVVASSTIADNSASGNGGGIASSNLSADDVRLRNTILTGNSGGVMETMENCAGPMTSQGYNLDSGSGCPFTEPGDISNGDAALDSLSPSDPLQVLQGNISPAFDLLPASQAINAANPTACYDALNFQNNDLPLVTDQRGEERVQDGRCDIGSVESQAPTAVTLASLEAATSAPSAVGLTWLAAGLVLLASLSLAALIMFGLQRAPSPDA